MKLALLYLSSLLLTVNVSMAQTYLHPDWLVQPDLPLSTGPVYVADAAKTIDDATFVVGDFRNGADFDISASDTAYVKTTYNHSLFLAKYDKNGNLVFEISLYSSFGFESGYNSITAVASDAQGNAYITGRFGYGFDFDPGPGVVSFPSGYYDTYMFVAKYDKDGHLLFANPVTTNNDNTFPSAIAVDRQSNVYISGTIAGSNNDFDPGTPKVSLNADKKGDGFFAKYDKNGTFLFAKLVTGSDAEGINGIAVDKLNNLLAIGYYNTSSNDMDPGPDTAKLDYKGGSDLFFAKYKPNGDYVFAKSVGGTGSDFASDIAADAKNNILITGSFNGNNADFDPGKGKVLRSAVNSIHTDVFVEKFDSLGNYTWVSTSGGSSNDKGGSLACDKEGNLFITGVVSGDDAVFSTSAGDVTLPSAGGYDVFYAMYSSAGACRYAYSIGSKEDELSGSLVITGDSLITFTGNFSGSLSFNPLTQKNKLTTPSPTAYFATYKSNTGAYLSAKKIGVFGYFRDQSDVTDVKQDKEGNTYITGSYTGITDFDPGSGKVLLTSENDLARDAANYDEDQFIAKYDADGKLLFVRTFTTTGHDAAISGMAIDDDQNVYICGSYYGQINFSPGTDTAVFGRAKSGLLYLYFAKYDNSGKYLYAVNLTSELSSFKSIALDKQRNIYLTGWLSGRAFLNPADSTALTSSIGEIDMLIAKYDNAGHFVYAKHIGERGNVQGYTDDVFVNDMAVSDSGRLVVCGNFRGKNTDFDPGPGKSFLSSTKSVNSYFVAAYTLDGDLLYATAADTSSAGQTEAYNVAFDGEEAVVSGMSYGKADLYPGADSAVITYDFTREPFFMKFNRTGGVQFINTGNISPAQSNGMDINDVAVDALHRIYITGDSYRKVDFDYGSGVSLLDTNANYVARYESDGSFDYVQRVDTSTAVMRSLFVNRRNEVILAADGSGVNDVDPGADSLLFTPPVYQHSAFFITKYKQVNEDKTPVWPVALSNRRAVLYKRMVLERSGSKIQ